MFRFLSFNARSLLNKLDLLPSLSSSSFNNRPPHLISICESWCFPHEPDSLYGLNNYTLYRCDRRNGNGGGVVMYVHNSTSHRLLTTCSMDGFESLWLEVDIANDTLVVGCAYRPPWSDASDFFNKLENCLKSTNISNRKVLLLGDYNAKHSNWLSTDTTDCAGDDLSYLCAAYNLEQHVDFPTCIVRGTPQSCLDLVISNLPSTCVHVTPCPPLGTADHLSIKGELRVNVTSGTPLTSRHTLPWSWSWEAEGVQALKQELSRTPLLPPDHLLDSYSCDELWEHWRSTLLNSAHRYCTKLHFNACLTSPSEQPHHKRPWMSDTIVNAIRTKHKLFRTFIRTRCHEDWSLFKTQRNHVTALVREAKSAFVMSSLQDEKNTASSQTPSSQLNRSNLYSFMKCIKTRPAADIPTLSYSGQTLVSATDKAVALNSFFIAESQRSVSNPAEQVPKITFPPVKDCLVEFSTSPDEICQLLNELDDRKSAGEDLIPTRLLKLTAAQISPSLSMLFNLSFRRGDQPQAWRDATVSPIHKKGPKTSPTNYRPISLLSVVSKVQEKVVHNRLFKHVEKHLPEEQSGFRKADGTELQLLRLIHEMSSHRDQGRAVAACFFDLSKAFDRVWHKGLLAKLEHLGVGGASLAWFRSYLTKRRQRVRLGQEVSPWLQTPAGVPQGSVLGPLLFLCYTIDLPLACRNSWVQCSQFADDTALIAAHKHHHQAEASLQKAVSSATDWLQRWHLLVNTTKTVVMSFQRHKNLTIILNGVRLQQVHVHRHLGLNIQSDLRWTSHIEGKIAKAKRSLHQLHRVRGSLTPQALVAIYSTYIRPIVEYGSLAYSNLSATMSDRLERLQRRAARICLRLSLFQPIHHSSLLHHASLPTLSSRRHYRQALLGHAMRYKKLPSHLLQHYDNTSAPELSWRLRKPRTYRLPTTRTSRHRDSPINLSMHRYNTLPIDCRAIEDPTSFKTSVSSLILSSICPCSQHPTI